MQGVPGWFKKYGVMADIKWSYLIKKVVSKISIEEVRASESRYFGKFLDLKNKNLK